jgi:hypothetical protein
MRRFGKRKKPAGEKSDGGGPLLPHSPCGYASSAWIGENPLNHERHREEPLPSYWSEGIVYWAVSEKQCFGSYGYHP